MHISVHTSTNDYLRCTKCEVQEHICKRVIRCPKKCVPRFLILEALISVQKFYLGDFFLPGGGNLRWSDLGNSNHFQSLKQLSVNNEHQFK